MTAAGDAVYRDSPLPLRSRVHPLRLGGDTVVSIKRDDELSFGASGSKVRKYASLVPYLAKLGVTDAIVIGGQNSNNVLAAAQYLPERDITPHLVLREQREADFPATVFDLIRQLVPDDRIHLLARAGWDAASWRTCQRIVDTAARRGRVARVVPEGGSHPASLPGATTLAVDVSRNERESGQRYDDVFIEAGSGLSALALALRSHADGAHRRIHVLCTAIDAARLRSSYRRMLRERGMPEGLVDRVHAHDAAPTPTLAAWEKAWDPVRETGRRNGVIFDPYYSGRLLPMLQDCLAAEHLDPAGTLMVHTGGGIGLLPYLEAQRRAGKACQR
jgi:1-aminocyclopropane-1-carboxylate deaminase/D-cysteine desulfhydrase-like pyridoxal-dependent ACC family enzyme